MLDQYKNKLQLVIKNYPSDSDEFSYKAAKAALAAYRQNKFWQYHDKLFENIDSFDNHTIGLIARELNLDMKKFDSDMRSAQIEGLIKRDIQDGIKAGVSGVPAVFVNGKRMENVSLPEFKFMIDAELNSKSRPVAGTSSRKPAK